MPSKDVAENYAVSRAWVDRLKQRRQATGEITPRQQPRWRTSILHAHLDQRVALIRAQPDRTLAELQAARRTPASLPTLCRTIKQLGCRFKKRSARRNTTARRAPRSRVPKSYEKYHVLNTDQLRVLRKSNEVTK